MVQPRLLRSVRGLTLASSAAEEIEAAGSFHTHEFDVCLGTSRGTVPVTNTSGF